MLDRILIETADATDEGEVFATTADGDVYIFDGVGYCELAYAVTMYGSINPNKWHHFRTIYGSKAYADSDEEQRTAYAERYEGLGDGADLAHVY